MSAAHVRMEAALAEGEGVEAALDSGDVLLERRHLALNLAQFPLQLLRLLVQAHDLIERLLDRRRNIPLRSRVSRALCEVMRRNVEA